MCSGLSTTMATSAIARGALDEAIHGRMDNLLYAVY